MADKSEELSPCEVKLNLIDHAAWDLYLRLESLSESVGKGADSVWISKDNRREKLTIHYSSRTDHWSMDVLRSHNVDHNGRSVDGGGR